MAIFKHGDMWQALAHVDHFLVTTNSFLRRDGCLVMGRGMALQAVQRYRWEAVRDTLLAAYHDALHAPAQSMRPVA